MCLALSSIALSLKTFVTITLPKAPASVDATQISAEEIHEKLDKGYREALDGRAHDAKEAFAAFKTGIK